MKSEGEEYEQSGSGNILKVVEREKVDAVMGQAEMTEREEDEKERQDVGSWWFQMAIERKAIQGWRPADWGKEWTQLLKVLDNPFNICHSLVTLVESTRYLGDEAPTIQLQILVMTPSLAADMLKKIAAKRPKPFRETIPKEEDNSNSKGAKIVDDKPAVRTDQSNLINTTVINNSERFDIDNNGGNQNVRDLITVEDNEEDFVRVESKRYESEGSSSEETIGEVSEEEGGEERGNEGLVEGKLEEGNDGMIVVGFEKDPEFEPIVVTDPFRDLITVEDNEEDFVRVESKRYESEGSSSEETIGEVSEEEGGEERGNEGLVEGKLEEGNDGMNVVGFEKDREVVGDWSIYVTPLLMGKDKYELIKQGGWKETMVAQIDDCDGNNGNQGGKTGWMMGWDESGRLEASPLGQVWAGLLMGKNKFESIRLKLTLESYLISVTEKSLKMALNKIIDREVLILVGQEPKKVLVLETFNKWRESSQVRDV
ncbi:hypothetical protein PPACK8108_LOCUS13657 [Phakopsora pachyrhizi]|uniref:Uncharacterized protein n=1 Tax=Phakopsora pachyrhizi TaxID=170000 RepID=A0AAV0B732_PHAPC|nr:hypothetical protein PPACK8108_LOCUS13657 [Phakopsora pachyrhizi]